MHKAHRTYQRFTGEERFELFLAALARGDEEEAAALGYSCPVVSYRQKDLEFHNRILAQREVMMMFHLETVRHLAILRLIHPAEIIVEELASDLAMCAFDSAIESHWNAVDPSGDSTCRKLGDPRTPCLDKLMSGSAGTAQVMLKSFSTMWDIPRDQALREIAHWLAALDHFAVQHWGVTGEQAMRTMFDRFDDLEPFLEQVGAVDVDPQQTDDRCQTLAAVWESTLNHVFPLPQ